MSAVIGGIGVPSTALIPSTVILTGSVALRTKRICVHSLLKVIFAPRLSKGLLLIVIDEEARDLVSIGEEKKMSNWTRVPEVRTEISVIAESLFWVDFLACCANERDVSNKPINNIDRSFFMFSIIKH